MFAIDSYGRKTRVCVQEMCVCEGVRARTGRMRDVHSIKQNSYKCDEYSMDFNLWFLIKSVVLIVWMPWYAEYNCQADWHLKSGSRTQLTEPMKMCEQSLVKRVTFTYLQFSPATLNLCMHIFIRFFSLCHCPPTCAIPKNVSAQAKYLSIVSDWLHFFLQFYFFFIYIFFILWTHLILICINVH